MSRAKSHREAAGCTGESRLDINWQDCQEVGSKSQTLILVSQLGQRSVCPAQEGGQPNLTSTMGSLLAPTQTMQSEWEADPLYLWPTEPQSIEHNHH